MAKFGTDLIRSAKEAIAIAKGEVEPARAFPPAPVEVAAIRKGLGLSQRKFATRSDLNSALTPGSRKAAISIKPRGRC